MPYILAVDDEDMNRLIIEEIIKDDYEVATASDGIECMASIAKRKPDLLLLDIAMPNMDGLTVCQKVRADEELKDLPIILLSGFASSDNISEGLAMGANSYITKPFTPSILRDEIKKYL